jgi:hypothetical protein
MPWKDVMIMSLRKEFVILARADRANISRLCRRFGISRETGCDGSAAIGLRVKPGKIRYHHGSNCGPLTRSPWRCQRLPGPSRYQALRSKGLIYLGVYSRQFLANAYGGVIIGKPDAVVPHVWFDKGKGQALQALPAFGHAVRKD